MPQKRNSGTPPPVMTWMKASPVLAISVIFDAVRFLFEQFWFFGPALAAVYCTSKVSGAVSTATAGTLGVKTAATLCGVAAGAVGYLGSAAIETFGVVMAIAIGLLGWLTIGLILLTTNSRIFKENEGHALWFVASLLISEVPIIGSIPGFTIITFKMYRTQIKKDKELFKKYQKEQSALQTEERRIYEIELLHEQQEHEHQQNEDDPFFDDQKQFEELEDALSELNNKENRTREENVRLVRASKIMENRFISDNDKDDPVLMAAYNRAMMGQREFANTPWDRNGFKFSNASYI